MEARERRFEENRKASKASTSELRDKVAAIKPKKKVKRAKS